MRVAAVLALTLCLTACGSDDTPEPDDTPLGQMMSSPEPRAAGAGSVVRVDVQGTREDGTVFQDDELVLLPLAGMTPGFARGVAGMREGETKTFDVTPEEGYGDNVPDGIPACETLTYEVTLHDVRQ